MALYHEAFGPMKLLDRAKSLAVRLLAIRESLRIRKEGTIMRQPPTNLITYPDRAHKIAREESSVAIVPIVNRPEVEATIQSV